MILLFEELFEYSSPTKLEEHFEMLCRYIKTNSVFEGITDERDLMNAELYCTRLCKNLMKKLGTARDIAFKSNI